MKPRPTPHDERRLTLVADLLVAAYRAANQDERRPDPPRCLSCGVSLLAPEDGHAAGCRRWGA